MGEQHEFMSYPDTPLTKLQRLAKAPTALERALKALASRGHRVVDFERVNGHWVFKLERRHARD